MCEYYEIITPDWACINNKNKSEISEIRNSLIHEALMENQPLGFMSPQHQPQILKRNMPLEMRNLICRLLVRILMDEPNHYTKSSVSTRQNYRFNL